MRKLWPNASNGAREEGPSFEGRILERRAPSVDFRLPSGVSTPSRAEDSVLFVAPRDEHATAHPVADWGDPTPACFERRASEPVRLSRPSTPRAGCPPLWSASITDLGGGEDEAPTLPVPALSAARPSSYLGGVLEKLERELLGGTTAARAARFGVTVAFLFAGVAVRALGGQAPTLDALTAMGDANFPAIAAVPPASADVARRTKGVDLAIVPSVRRPSGIVFPTQEASTSPSVAARPLVPSTRPSPHHAGSANGPSARAPVRSSGDLARRKDVPHFDLPRYDRPSLRNVVARL
jgi:hypothetical protein